MLVATRPSDGDVKPDASLGAFRQEYGNAIALIVHTIQYKTYTHPRRLPLLTDALIYCIIDNF